MERTKYWLTGLLLLLVVAAYSQNSTVIYNAFLKGDMVRWKSAIDSMEQVKGKSNKEMLDLLNYQYGYVAWCVSSKKDDLAERYISKAEENISLLEKRKFSIAEVYAYRAAFIGFEIGLSPYKAPFVGSKSEKFANMSVEADNNSILGQIQLGNIMFYKPRVLGGSKTDALKYYLKAESLFDRNERLKHRNWNYLNLMVSIINAYSELKQYEAAKRYCVKVLTYEPGFEWVRNSLYPRISKK